MISMSEKKKTILKLLFSLIIISNIIYNSFHNKKEGDQLPLINEHPQHHPILKF
jgi:hypothetical protein